MLNSKTLLEMSRVEIERIDPSTLVNISTVYIDQKLSGEEKILSAMEQMGNPYCFLSGDVPVRVRFAAEGKQLSDSLISYFSLLKQK